MENVMPRDDLTTLLNNILTQVNRLNEKQDQQTKELNEIKLQTQKTNGRVTRLEDGHTLNVRAIKSLERRSGRKLNIPTNILYLLAFAGVIVLLIVATAMGINVKGII